MNSNQRRRAGKPVTYEGTRAKYISWIENCQGKIHFRDFVRGLKPREIAGFMIHGERVVDSIGYNTTVQTMFKRDIKEFREELAEKELLGNDDNS